jgi:carbonic anhydrase/acetyltransferase-like protein (isoleucine patch superfamily)
VLVTANTVLDAAPGGRICIGDDSNIQDNVVVQATRAVPATASPSATRRWWPE